MPSLASEIAAAVRNAYKAQTPLNIAGAGTKSFLGRPAENAETLDVTGHNGLIEYDPAELVYIARAGTPLRDVELTLNGHGQMLGFEPPFVENGATLGGAVAAGLAGPRRFCCGAVRDFILGVTFVNGRGETITAGGKVMKNVAGFDLFRPMARSMGTLGVMLNVAVRVTAKPGFERTVIHAEKNELTALKKMSLWPLETQAITAASWDGGHIRIRLSGSEPGIEQAYSLIGGQWLDDPGYWHELNNFRLDFFQQPGRLWRISVVPMSSGFAALGSQLIDWGGAQRWLKSGESPAAIRARAAEMGGYAECFSIDPEVPTFHPLESNVSAMNRSFKRALDPSGILNPGRLYPEL